MTGAHFYDLRDRAREFKDVYSPTDYTHSQRLGAELRERGLAGMKFKVGGLSAEEDAERFRLKLLRLANVGAGATIYVYEN